VAADLTTMAKKPRRRLPVGRAVNRRAEIREALAPAHRRHIPTGGSPMASPRDAVLDVIEEEKL